MFDGGEVDRIKRVLGRLNGLCECHVPLLEHLRDGKVECSKCGLMMHVRKLPCGDYIIQREDWDEHE